MFYLIVSLQNKKITINKGGMNMEFSMSITKGLGNQKHNNRTQKETTKKRQP